MAIIKRLKQTFKSNGLKGVFFLIKERLFRKKNESVKNISIYKKIFSGKRGIEIGGPSSLFHFQVPVYPVIRGLDGCNFSKQTIWEGHINEGESYQYYKKRTGHQFICEASDLKEIPNEEYDFLIASHCLEHCANCLKTVREWLRVIKKGASILLVLPDKQFTFDHNRPVTKFDHLLQDYKNNVDETDLSHLGEILRLHDLSMDKPAGSVEQFSERSQDNINNRCLHHHVFDFDLLKELYKYFDLEIIDTSFVEPYHQIILGIKK